jgi:23S rRNA (adenine2503-C2)-methyltransferase
MATCRPNWIEASLREVAAGRQESIALATIHDAIEVEAFCKRHGVEQAQLRRFRNCFYKKQLSDDAALEHLPAPVRASFSDAFDFHSLQLHERHDSQLDGATRLIFRTSSELLIETVILRVASGRTALCVSSQVGCAAHCRFCATGSMGVARNLTAAEILDQVVQANQMLLAEGRRVRNLVFMGMGEPFHNEEQIYAALELLGSPKCFDLAPRRTLISTVGIPAAMVRCANRYPQVRIALSLHSAQQAVRERILPIAKHYSLGELRAALVEIIALGKRPVMIEYVLLEGVNDSPQDAAALIDYLRALDVHVNLIPYNPIAEAPELQATNSEARQAFARMLKEAGLKVTVRRSLGVDIAAACGQLVRHENRQQVVMAAQG